VPTLGALAALCESERRPRRRLRLSGAHAGAAARSDEARFDALLRQGELCRDRIEEPYRAIDAYAAALALRPDDLEVQRALVPLYESTRQFGAAVKTLSAMAEQLQEPEAQRDVWLRVGDLQWEHERAWPAAAEAYNRALDLDPLHAPSLQRLEKMLAEAKQWKALEESYIRMIRRLPKENRKARVALWRTLGELYTRVLKDPAGAARAYEVVLSLEPEDPEVGLTLAQIYRRHPEKKNEAAAICQRVIPFVADPNPATRLFAEVAYEQGQYDAAFCGLGGLMLTRAAQEEEVRAYRALLDKAPAWPAGGVTDGQWQRALLHPSCRGPLARLTALLYAHAPDLFSSRRRAMGLKRKERVDLSDKGPKAPVRLRYFDVWGRVASALGLRDVEHYRRPGLVDPPLLLPGAPRPALYVGEKHEVFKTMPVRQVAWLVGRQVATARPELAPVRGLSAGDFVAMIEAVAQLLGTTLGLTEHVDGQVVGAWTKALRAQLSDAAMSEIRAAAGSVLGQVGLQDILTYVEGAEHYGLPGGAPGLRGLDHRVARPRGGGRAGRDAAGQTRARAAACSAPARSWPPCATP
jgi:tetratricopeptide (TPR) repeat protein